MISTAIKPGLLLFDTLTEGPMDIRTLSDRLGTVETLIEVVELAKEIISRTYTPFHC